MADERVGEITEGDEQARVSCECVGKEYAISRKLMLTSVATRRISEMSMERWMKDQMEDQMNAD